MNQIILFMMSCLEGHFSAPVLPELLARNVFLVHCCAKRIYGGLASRHFVHVIRDHVHWPRGHGH